MTPRTFVNIFALTSFSWVAVTFWTISALISAPQTPLALTHVRHKSEDINITDAWVRATPTGSKVAAAYFTVKSNVDDVLLSATTPAAGRTELHQTTQSINGSLQMREIPAGVDLPAGKAVSLAPGGTHVMLMDLKAPLEEGFEIPFTLTFKHAGKLHTRVAIKPISFMPGMGGDSMPHGEMGQTHDHHNHQH